MWEEREKNYGTPGWSHSLCGEEAGWRGRHILSAVPACVCVCVCACGKPICALMLEELKKGVTADEHTNGSFHLQASCSHISALLFYIIYSHFGAETYGQERQKEFLFTLSEGITHFSLTLSLVLNLYNLLLKVINIFLCVLKFS